MSKQKAQKANPKKARCVPGESARKKRRRKTGRRRKIPCTMRDAMEMSERKSKLIDDSDDLIFGVVWISFGPYRNDSRHSVVFSPPLSPFTARFLSLYSFTVSVCARRFVVSTIKTTIRPFIQRYRRRISHPFFIALCSLVISRKLAAIYNIRIHTKGRRQAAATKPTLQMKCNYLFYFIAPTGWQTDSLCADAFSRSLFPFFGQSLAFRFVRRRRFPFVWAHKSGRRQKKRRKSVIQTNQTK